MQRWMVVAVIAVMVIVPPQARDSIIITGKTKSKSFFHGTQRGWGQTFTGTRASVAWLWANQQKRKGNKRRKRSKMYGTVCMCESAVRDYCIVLANR
jgi:hypothetical protein